MTGILRQKYALSIQRQYENNVVLFWIFQIIFSISARLYQGDLLQTKDVNRISDVGPGLRLPSHILPPIRPKK